MKSERGEVSVSLVIKVIIAIICFIAIVFLVYDKNQDDSIQNSTNDNNVIDSNVYIEVNEIQN